MESNPEEFNVSSGNYGKWGRILEQIVLAKEAGSDKLPFPNHINGLTAAEINAVYAMYSRFLRKRFDDYVMREILADAEELSYSLATAPNVVLGTPSYAFGYADHAQHVNKHKLMLYTLGLKETV
jgi:hypothetical protein